MFQEPLVKGNLEVYLWLGHIDRSALFHGEDKSHHPWTLVLYSLSNLTSIQKGFLFTDEKLQAQRG